MNKKFLAIIPARGGSKSLPGKNMKKLRGLSLIGHAICGAKKSRYISRVVVSTDDNGIARLARRLGSEVVMRPASLAKDNSRMAGAIMHCLKELKKKDGYVPDALMLLQPTSPLRTSLHIDEAFDILLNMDCDAVISVFKPMYHPLKSFKTYGRGYLRAMVKSKFSFTPRQALPTPYVPNGAIYLIKTAAFVKYHMLFTPKTLPYIMSRSESVDIDDMDDFRYAEYLMRRKKRS